MRLFEFETSDIAPGNADLLTALSKEGYKHLGSGAFVDTYRAPDGTVMKVFFRRKMNDRTKFNRNEEAFIDFAKYCAVNPDNNFLPQILKYGPEELPQDSGDYYFVVRMERLFEFSGPYGKNGKKLYNNNALATAAADLAMLIYDYDVERAYKIFCNSKMLPVDDAARNQLIMHLGRDKLHELSWTLGDLARIAKQKGYDYDLHSGNFLLTSTGDIIISDPFASDIY